MMWEEAAESAIANAAETVAMDEVRAVVYMQTGENERFDVVEEEFKSSEDVRLRLTEIGETQWCAYAPFESGVPLVEPDVEDAVDGAIRLHRIDDFFGRVSAPDEGEKIISAHDLTRTRSGLVLQIDVAEINDELIRYLALHPELMHELNPRKFESLVAELFKDKGYDVELTPPTRDGGFDIRAFHRSDIGACLTLIECKRYAPEKAVSVDVVRGLYGVVCAQRATRGIVATTSRFSSDAASFQKQNQYQLHLADFEAIKKWLADYRSGLSRHW